MEYVVVLGTITLIATYALTVYRLLPQN